MDGIGVRDDAMMQGSFSLSFPFTPFPVLMDKEGRECCC